MRRSNAKETMLAIKIATEASILAVGKHDDTEYGMAGREKERKRETGKARKREREEERKRGREELRKKEGTRERG